MQKEKPILFSTPMVQAILDGRKTQTRRIVKNIPAEAENNTELLQILISGWHSKYGSIFCPYGKPGDVLWVRETWKSLGFSQDTNAMLISYKDGASKWVRVQGEKKLFAQNKWKPSIHMPKDAARIWLKNNKVRVERLHDISDEDAIKEGVEFIPGFATQNWKDYSDKYAPPFISPQHSFISLWDSINGEESWDENPWVWVVEFEVLSTTGKPEIIHVHPET